MNPDTTRTLRELDRIIHCLPLERQRLYRQLVEGALMTPLRLLSPDSTALPGHNIYLKLEYENDVGCHHRRLYPFVFALNEAEGRIIPAKTPVVEASIGGAACAFAYCAKFLGFNAPRPPLMTPTNEASINSAGSLHDDLLSAHRGAAGRPLYHSPSRC